jgi:hypothetical protein
MMFQNPIPPRGTLEGYSLALRKAANEAAGRVLPLACPHAPLSRSIPLARQPMSHLAADTGAALTTWRSEASRRFPLPSS